MTIDPSRRAALGLLAAGIGAAFVGRSIATAADNLKPGEFVWNPERSPSGPVAIIVSLPEQRVYV
ncbi:MAG: hypothetical protein RLO48_04485 [Bauldia litoralis]